MSQWYDISEEFLVDPHEDDLTFTVIVVCE